MPHSQASLFCHNISPFKYWASVAHFANHGHMINEIDDSSGLINQDFHFSGYLLCGCCNMYLIPLCITRTNPEPFPWFIPGSKHKKRARSCLLDLA